MLEVGDFIGIRPLVGAGGTRGTRSPRDLAIPPPTSDEDEVNDVLLLKETNLLAFLLGQTGPSYDAAAREVYQRLESMLNSGFEGPVDTAVYQISCLLEEGAFKDPTFNPLLENAWKRILESSSTDPLLCAGAFVEAVGKYLPEFFQSRLEETLRCFVAAWRSAKSMVYASVINLITDPAVWLQNMKILINHFTIESYQFHEYESNRAFCAILSPSHPFHKMLPDAGLKQKIGEILTQISKPLARLHDDDEAETIAELCIYYGQ